jgi:serine/threonine protein phosphatase 1
MSRTIAIGDIHGCALALRALLDAISPLDNDTILTLGDYVDRGPDSRGVVDQLLALQPHCRLVPLLGNHEIMMLSVLRGELDSCIWERYGGLETIASYAGDLTTVEDSHRKFLEGCRHYHETDRHLFMHANYLAELELADQPDQILFWTHVSSVLPPRHRSGKTAIVGHTPQIEGEILDLGHLICIDTCCFAGGWLTALDVETGQVWQADRLGRMRDEA